MVSNHRMIDEELTRKDIQRSYHGANQATIQVSAWTDRKTDKGGPISSSLTVEHEEYLTAIQCGCTERRIRTFSLRNAFFMNSFSLRSRSMIAEHCRAPETNPTD